MTVYLGTQGAVQIKRESGAPINGQLVPSDVSVIKRRFSLNDYDVQGELIAGDQVDITRMDGGNLQLVELGTITLTGAVISLLISSVACVCMRSFLMR